MSHWWCWSLVVLLALVLVLVFLRLRLLLLLLLMMIIIIIIIVILDRGWGRTPQTSLLATQKQRVMLPRKSGICRRVCHILPPK